VGCALNYLFTEDGKAAAATMSPFWRSFLLDRHFFSELPKKIVGILAVLVKESHP
jgi:hypothetical protein